MGKNGSIRRLVLKANAHKISDTPPNLSRPFQTSTSPFRARPSLSYKREHSFQFAVMLAMCLSEDRDAFEEEWTQLGISQRLIQHPNMRDDERDVLTRDIDRYGPLRELIEEIERDAKTWEAVLLGVLEGGRRRAAKDAVEHGAMRQIMHGCGAGAGIEA
ncbi:eukaryotic translation initiation factor 3 [Pseudohyphozyma bogoriensis]|nr:eukaryotic translation initiation factor 3 [Pseudohyphozyma bogoriensis]